MGSVKVVVEKCEDGYIAYPIALKGVVVGEGIRMRKLERM